MQVISLFSGIGGFELAAKWMHWDNIVSCEINEFGRKVLKYHFPNSYHHDDVKTLNYETIKKESRYNPKETTIVVGGFPCQPFSVAGKQKGTDDDRHLWPEMLRIIREVKPEYVVGENVRGILNIGGGLVFEQVCSSLEDEGYIVQTFIIPAAGKNAPHKRDRVWIIAYTNSDGRQNRCKNVRRKTKEKERECEQMEATFANGKNGVTTYPNGIGRSCKEYRKTESRWTTKTSISPNWENWPIESPIFGGNDGIPSGLVDITFPKWRNESIKAMGNAIVPQIAFEIFKAIQETEKSK